MSMSCFLVPPEGRTWSVMLRIDATSAMWSPVADKRSTPLSSVPGFRDWMAEPAPEERPIETMSLCPPLRAAQLPLERFARFARMPSCRWTGRRWTRSTFGLLPASNCTPQKCRSFSNPTPVNSAEEVVCCSGREQREMRKAERKGLSLPSLSHSFLPPVRALSVLGW